MLSGHRNPALQPAAVVSAAAFLAESARITESALENALPSGDMNPARLHQAMRYSIFAGGKRLRPALVLGACRACAGPDVLCSSAMTAVEALHTYTLIHDDLPAMDDDDLRRGRATCHRAFDEATAILAGDALQAFAFEQVAALGADAVRVLARAAGSLGIVGGQQEDLDAEAMPVTDSDECRDRLMRIHRGKTAALIRASCELGALAAGASTAERAALVDFGEAVGLAFQIADDILDATASAATLGKTPGKDAAQKKLTYVAVYGLAGARSEAARAGARAQSALEPLGQFAAQLETLARFVIERDH